MLCMMDVLGVELVGLEVAYRLAEEACTDEEKEPCGRDEEYGETETGRGLVDDEADTKADKQSYNRGKRDGRGFLAERNL